MRVSKNVACPQKDFPQQLPGPAQPASAGLDPQHEVSPGPGKPDADAPEKEDGFEIILFMFLLPHDTQTGSSPGLGIKISLSFPQSLQR